MAIESTLDFHEPSRQQQEWEQLSPAEKKHALYMKQVNLLKTFRARNAISHAQYEKSFQDLTEKMGEKTKNESN